MGLGSLRCLSHIRLSRTAARNSRLQPLQGREDFALPSCGELGGKLVQDPPSMVYGVVASSGRAPDPMLSCEEPGRNITRKVRIKNRPASSREASLVPVGKRKFIDLTQDLLTWLDQANVLSSPPSQLTRTAFLCTMGAPSPGIVIYCSPLDISGYLTPDGANLDKCHSQDTWIHNV